MFKSRRTTRVALSIVLAVIAIGGDAFLKQHHASALRTAVIEGREVVEGEVIVRYKSEAGAIGRERAEFKAGSAATRPLGRHGARRLQSTKLTTAQMLAALRDNPDVDYVEPNYVIRANAIPN